MSQNPFRYLFDLDHCLRTDPPARCVGCGQMCAEFGFIVFYEEGYDEYDVCAECLSAERLKDLDLPLNDPDVDALQQNVAALLSDKTGAEREAYAIQRTDEVTYRTPVPAILNMFVWPVHCVDYVVFHRRVTARDVSALTSDGDGQAFLKQYLEPAYSDYDADFIKQSWEDGLDDHAKFYLWRCQTCSEYLITYTMD